jgi:hypothetical protein
MKKQKYKVWFNQVNQTVFEVSATCTQKAVEKATKEWNKEHKNPFASYVEDEEGKERKVNG